MAIFQFSAVSDGQAISFIPCADVLSFTLLNTAPFQPQLRSQHGSD